MSHEQDKLKNSKRRFEDDNAVKKQLKIAKQHNSFSNENKVVKEDGIDKLFHEPQHDHIVSRDEAKRLGWTDKQINHPSNIQYISAIQNFMKRNFTKEMWRAVSPTIEQLFKD